MKGAHSCLETMKEARIEEVGGDVGTQKKRDLEDFLEEAALELWS